MNQQVNIGGDPNDKFYRYKRDKVQIANINKKGGLVYISNIDVISNQLKASKAFIDKLYKHIRKNNNTQMPEMGKFKGSLTISDFEKSLCYMIDRFLLCKQCKLPEWDGNVCAVCGYSTNNKGAVNHAEIEEKKISDELNKCDKYHEYRKDKTTECKIDKEVGIEVSDLYKQLYNKRDVCDIEKKKIIYNVLGGIWHISNQYQLTEWREKNISVLLL
jgi:hypothetical protein